MNGKQKGSETAILLSASGISTHTTIHMLEWVTPLYLDSMTHFKVSRKFSVDGIGLPHGIVALTLEIVPI